MSHVSADRPILSMHFYASDGLQAEIWRLLKGQGDTKTPESLPEGVPAANLPDDGLMETQIVIRQLCLSCGLCCNGVLFKNVELQPGDDVVALRKGGLPVDRLRPKPAQSLVLPQPCPALGMGNCCAVYSHRPARCQQFECALFKSVANDSIDLAGALAVVKNAQHRAARVRKLLAQTGDDDNTIALSLRCKRVQRRFERGEFDDHQTDSYAELTLAIHALNVALSTRFYP